MRRCDTCFRSMSGTEGQYVNCVVKGKIKKPLECDMYANKNKFIKKKIDMLAWCN